MPKDPVFTQSGELSDEDMRVFPTARVEISDVDPQRLLIQVHYYPSQDAYLAKKTDQMNFILPMHGAEAMANTVLTVLEKMRQQQKKENPFRKN
jgi:hypothetical protein